MCMTDELRRAQACMIDLMKPQFWGQKVGGHFAQTRVCAAVSSVEKVLSALYRAAERKENKHKQAMKTKGK